MNKPFHLSLPCRSVSATRHFYINELGMKSGRATSTWIDIDAFGNQITFNKSGSFKFDYQNYRLGDSIIPSFHFGIVLEKPEWTKLYNKIKKKNLTITEQRSYLEAEVGAHKSYFLEDPNGYTVEFKCFEAPDDIFQF